MTIGIDASKLAARAKTGVEWYVHHLLGALFSVPTHHSLYLYTKEPLSLFLPTHILEKKIWWPFPALWTQGGLSLEMVLHAPDLLFIPSSAMPILLPRLTVTTIHDVGFLYDRSYRSSRELAYLDWSTRRAVARATRIIVVSEFTKQELIVHFGARAENIAVVHHGYVPPILPADQERQHIRMRYGIDRPYLIFVSRIDSRKNVDVLVSAFEHLKTRGVFDGDLVLVGPLGFDGQRILRRIAESPHAHAIHHLGWVEEDEKCALLHGAEMFVFPSAYEGFGIGVLEAQSLGVPVVCSQTTSLPEVGGDGAYYIDPKNSEAIAQAVESLLGDRELRGELVRKGFENCRRFSWEKAARQTIQVCDDIEKLTS